MWFQNQAIKTVFSSTSNDQGEILPIEHFDPGRRRFYKVNRCDYPLLPVAIGLHSSVNFTGNESDDFCKFPLPFFAPDPVPVFLEFQLPTITLHVIVAMSNICF